MTKFLTSKFDNQLEAHRILEKKLNLVKHKKNLYKCRNYTRTNILQEQDAISLNNKFVSNDNIMNTKRNKTGEPIQMAMSLRSKQNENSSGQIQLSNTVEANYSKDFNCFSQSVAYSSSSHCNSKLTNNNTSIDSSNEVARKSLKSRQTRLNTPIKKQSSKLSQNQNNSSVEHMQIEEPLLGFPEKKKNITATTKDFESMRTAHTTKTNEDLVPSYRQLRSSLSQTGYAFNHKNLQTNNTQLSALTTDFLKTYTSELTHLENNCQEKTDISVPNFTHDRTLQAYVNITKHNDNINSLSGKKCLLKPLESRVRTRSMGQPGNVRNQADQKSQEITSAFSSQRRKKRPDKEKHVIELKEETIVQRNLQLTTHFHSKSDTVSCNLQGNNLSCDKAIQGNKNHSVLNIKQQKLRCLVRKNKRKPSLVLRKNRNIAETILQTNLQHLVDSNLKDDCDFSMEVNKKNECEINKSIKIGKTKTNVHRSIKKKEIIKSECHIDIKKKGQHSSNKCEHNAFKTTEKTLVSKKINKRKLIGSFKKVTQARNNNIKIINNFKDNRELIIPLVKLENLSASEISQLMHNPRYIKNKMNNSGKKEMQYAVKDIRKQKCTIHNQYKITKVKKNDKFNKVHNNIKKRENQSIDDLHKSKEENMYLAQDVNNFASLDQLTMKRLGEQVVNKDNNTSSLSNIKEHFTNTAVYQRDIRNELKVNETQDSVLYKDSIGRESIIENQSSELNRNECETSTNNEGDKAETLQDNNFHLQTNELLENIYQFYLKNKIKCIKGATEEKLAKYMKEKCGMPTIIAICMKCKEVLNLLQQFSAKTNFTRDEPLQIECVVCNVHMHSLSRFQQHLMDAHLQCDSNDFLRTKKRYIVDMIHFNMDKENCKFRKYKCCCCLKVFNHQGTFKRHLTYIHKTSCQFLDEMKKRKRKKTNVLNKNQLKSSVIQTTEQPKRPSKAYPYHCKICPKKYMEKRSLLSHMSKHAMDSNNSENVKKDLQEILQDNNASIVENNVNLPGTCIKALDDHCNDALNSVIMNKDPKEATCNPTAEEIVPEKINNSSNDNAFRLWRTDVKRQKLMRKLKRDGTVQQTVCWEQKEIRCKLCNKEFNSYDLLKEHMFFLHDSVLDDQKVSNLLVSYFSDSNDADDNESTLDDENLINEHNIPKKNVLEIPRKEENRIYENIMCKMLNDCSINRSKKWYCNLCKKNFPSHKNYVCHKYYVHKDVFDVHVCDNCNKVLTSVKMVNIHICTGRKITAWNCKRCNQKFINGIRLMQHNVSHHFETAGPYTCHSCELSFLTKHMLEKHVSGYLLTNGCNNINNFIDASASSQNSLLHNLNTTSSNIESNAKSDITSHTEQNGDHATENNTSTTSYTEHLNESTETTHISMNKFLSSLESNMEEMFKCKDCDIVCHTKKEMKFHLQKLHNIDVDVCEFCNGLYVTNELLKHLINFHIVICDFDLRKDNINAQLMYNRVEDLQQNIVKLLGLRRLITLYEYQRFNNIPKDDCFNCAACVTKFVNTQTYKIHYLQCHDTTCLLCNIEFKHQYQAFEHKIKIHVSAESYLWLIEKLTATILQFNKNGNSLDDVIVQYSEKRIHDNEIYNNKFEELNDKEFEYELSVII